MPDLWGLHENWGGKRGGKILIERSLNQQFCSWICSCVVFWLRGKIVSCVCVWQQQLGLVMNTVRASTGGTYKNIELLTRNTNWFIRYRNCAMLTLIDQMRRRQQQQCFVKWHGKRCEATNNFHFPFFI